MASLAVITLLQADQYHYNTILMLSSLRCVVDCCSQPIVAAGAQL